jgi:hypothetical protein
MLGALAIPFVGMSVAAVSIVLRKLNDVSERGRVLDAYKVAWDARPATPGTDEQLLQAMRNHGVPSIYSEPHSELVYEALDCWRAGVTPRDTRRRL